MSNAIFFAIGMILISVAIRGNLGSLLGSFLTPAYMEQTTS